MTNIWDRFEEYLLIAGMWIMVVLVFAQVVMRYLFQYSLPWSEETSRFLFLWLVWIGAGYAVKMRAHIRIEAFTNLLSSENRRLMEFFSTFVWFCFCIFFAWKGSELTWKLYVREQLSPIMQMPMAYAYAAIPAGTILMIIRLIEDMARQVREMRCAGGTPS